MIIKMGWMNVVGDKGAGSNMRVVTGLKSQQNSAHQQCKIMISALQR